MQTQQEERLTAGQLTRRLIGQQGAMALFNGISASVLRQMTYSTVRFGIYESGKQYYQRENIKDLGKRI